jgi:hypothetical protein
MYISMFSQIKYVDTAKHIFTNKVQVKHVLVDAVHLQIFTDQPKLFSLQ